MPVSDLVSFAHYHQWANRRLLTLAEKIPLDPLTANVSLSGGSAFDTLRHMLDVQWSWRLACLNQPPTDLLWKIEPLEDLASVIAYWQVDDERLLDYVQSLPAEAFEHEVAPPWASKPYPIKHILLHILNHGTGHRNELGWYFTKLGYSPGDIEFLEYYDDQRK